MFECSISIDATRTLKFKARLTDKQFKVFLQLSTAAKQTIAEAWKMPILNIAETKNRMKQSLIHAKIDDLDKKKQTNTERIQYCIATMHRTFSF